MGHRRFHCFLEYDYDMERYMVDLDLKIRWRCSVFEMLRYPYESTIGFRLTTNPSWSWGLKEVQPDEARRLIAESEGEPEDTVRRFR
jgi:hypothetical protein